MGFRSDREAEHAQRRALEERVAELEAENAELRGGDGGDGGADGRDDSDGAFRRELVLPSTLLVLTLGGGCVAALRLGQPALAAVMAVAAVMVVSLATTLAVLVEVVPPGFVLVISGRPTRRPDGRVVGYRAVAGGRTLRMPILERVDRLDCRLRSVEAKVRDAFSKGGVAIEMTVVAHYRLYPDFPKLENAVDRFLGRDPREVDAVARETLEATLRTVVAQLTPDEIRHDPDRFADHAVAEAGFDMDELGLCLEEVSLVSLEQKRD